MPDMTVIITLDAKNGLSLFGKRLSKDRKLNEEILDSFGRIYASPYTAAMFAAGDAVTSPIPESLPHDAAVFIETDEIPDSADTLIVYRWNRRYPSDRKYVPEEHSWHLISSSDFLGCSHDMITKEVYGK